MDFSTSRLIQYDSYVDNNEISNEQSNQVLEVRTRSLSRLQSGSPYAGPPSRILREDSPFVLDNAVFPLPAYQLDDGLVLFQTHIAQLLSSCNIVADVSEFIAADVAHYVGRITAGNRELSFHIVVIVDYVRIPWMELFRLRYPMPVWLGGGNEGGAVEVAEEAPQARRKVRMERLEDENGGEELGDCCICLDELKCSEGEVVKIPCGHVYHESCISKWLDNSHFCPLCKRALPLED